MGRRGDADRIGAGGLAFTVMAIYRWYLALLVLGGVVLYALLLLWFQRILRRAHDHVRERVAELSALSEAIAGRRWCAPTGRRGQPPPRWRERSMPSSMQSSEPLGSAPGCSPRPTCSPGR